MSDVDSAPEQPKRRSTDQLGFVTRDELELQLGQFMTHKAFIRYAGGLAAAFLVFGGGLAAWLVKKSEDAPGPAISAMREEQKTMNERVQLYTEATSSRVGTVERENTETKLQVVALNDKIDTTKRDLEKKIDGQADETQDVVRQESEKLRQILTRGR